jgi:hypothetical protein
MTEKVSASTLARRAAKTKNKAEAKRLREQAAQLRRDEREAKRFQSSTVSQLNQGIGNNAQRAASFDISPDVMSLANALPWYQREEEIAKLMKAAKKPEEFKTELSNMVHASRYDGRLKALQEHDGRVEEINKQWAINFVSGFIARMNAEAKANGGPLPRSVVVDGATMARVIDALGKAGYTADGVTGLRRAVG